MDVEKKFGLIKIQYLVGTKFNHFNNRSPLSTNDHRFYKKVCLLKAAGTSFHIGIDCLIPNTGNAGKTRPVASNSRLQTHLIKS